MRIDRYVIRQILAAMIIVVVSLTCVIWLSQSLRFIDMIVNRGLPLATFIYFTVLLMPTWLSLVLPIACFAATMFVYSRMSGDRELVVLTASGLGPLGLARPAIVVALVVTALGYLLSLYLVPISYRGFKELQFQIRHNYTNVLLREGVFNSMGDDVTVFVRARQPNGDLSGIIVQDDREADESVTLLAESGALILDRGSPRVLMVNGNRQAKNNQTGRINILYFDRYTVDLGGLQEAVQRTARDQNELFVDELLNPTERITQERNFGKYIAEGHSRLVTPLLGLALPLIGLVVVLRGEFSRRGRNSRLVAAVLLVGLVQAAVLGSKYSAAKELSLLPLMYSAAIVPILVCLILLARQRMRRPRSGTIPTEGTPA
ncbi:LPS export ABC transporter permease LptF [Nisaea acidiphila]|uniref:LPS export ABC transporter permease LptF n=1 Tax=Nisaea acidiphila TaxID=1862145 RepID=A0A9J7AXH0_9PROT|nr:LPS export ABC transporter permease LptF [Nisaea acidiphila]UUX50948.1 LPS export ABC transporter permease LptF [Nisaea acidiphila]